MTGETELVRTCRPVFHYDIKQGEQEWFDIRRGKATASNFSDIIQPVALQPSKSWTKYAARLVAERYGVQIDDFISHDMQTGIEMEPSAFYDFRKYVEPSVVPVGFVQPFADAQCGGSPDGIIDKPTGLETLEIKIPRPETMVLWIDNGGLPTEHRLQVQGQMWITGAVRCHFYVWSAQLEPWHIVVERDDSVITEIEKCVSAFLVRVDEMENTEGIARRTKPVDHIGGFLLDT